MVVCCNSLSQTWMQLMLFKFDGRECTRALPAVKFSSRESLLGGFLYVSALSSPQLSFR